MAKGAVMRVMPNRPSLFCSPPENIRHCCREENYSIILTYAFREIYHGFFYRKDII